MKTLQGITRTKYCGQFRQSDLGQMVVAQGWVDNRRDFGGLIFIDLRDKTGILQVVLNAKVVSDFETCEHIRNEYVLSITGTLVERSQDTINPKLETGLIELLASDVVIINTSSALPFSFSDEHGNEMTRLKYRYLDLRTPQLQKNLVLRSQVCKVTRTFLDSQGFTEVETPMLGKSTPEGARDYLVPSRMFEGAFFALPQSPQLYKQLLMIGGIDRYYQIARCFRDEDLRADRQPEFTQIDLEMSFIDQIGQVMSPVEQLVQSIFKTIDCPLSTPFNKMTYDEAMSRFGCDKPDTRFGLELIDISAFALQSSVAGFHDSVKNGGSVRVINAKNLYDQFTRKDLDGLAYFVKDFGAIGLSWIAITPEGAKGSLVKFFPAPVLIEMLKAVNAEANDVLLFVADADNEVVFQSLSRLRLFLGEKFKLIDHSRYDVLWVTDFPMFEYSTTQKRLVAKHHPFTSPKDEDLQFLETEPLKVKAKAYDLVMNGYEVGGGSLRIYDQNVQQRIFSVLGYSKEEIEDKFGFFVQAFGFGTPPHGGLALGLDRLMMLLTKSDDIRSVIAFPKIQTSMDVMTCAPAAVEKKQLNDIHITVKPSILTNLKKE